MSTSIPLIAVPKPPASQLGSESDSDRDELELDGLRNSVFTRVPKRPFRLGYWSVIALVVNRMIGTSVSRSQVTVY
jgi:hypothetical protein